MILDITDKSKIILAEDNITELVCTCASICQYKIPKHKSKQERKQYNASQDTHPPTSIISNVFFPSISFATFFLDYLKANPRLFWYLFFFFFCMGYPLIQQMEADKATKQYFYNVANIFPRYSQNTSLCHFHKYSYSMSPVTACTNTRGSGSSEVANSLFCPSS